MTAGTGTQPAATRTWRLPAGVRPFVRRYGLLLVLAAVAIAFQLLTDGLFMSSRNVPLLLRQAAVTGIVAAGVCLVIVAGEIDLSIGSSVGLCAICVADLTVKQGWPIWAALAATGLLGLLLGAWQGFLITTFRVPAFVVTLGGLLVFRGIGLVVTEGNTIAGLPEGITRVGSAMLSLAPSLAVLLLLAGAVLAARRLAGHRLRGAVSLPVVALGVIAAGAVVAYLSAGPGLPVPVVILIATAAVLGVVATLTPFGRRLYAIGGNRQAALLSGINVRRNVLGLFCLMGVLYAVAGTVLVARLNGAAPDGAPFLELDAIAAAVIGGTSLMGGVGRVGGAVVGAVLTASVSNGLSLMNVNSFYQLVASGLILVVAVAVDVRAKAVGS
jgi:D-xylose transport system permease protein